MKICFGGYVLIAFLLGALFLSACSHTFNNETKEAYTMNVEPENVSIEIPTEASEQQLASKSDELFKADQLDREAMQNADKLKEFKITTSKAVRDSETIARQPVKNSKTKSSQDSLSSTNSTKSTLTPAPEPKPEPTPIPTPESALEPTSEPIPEPTPEPVPEPTPEPFTPIRIMDLGNSGMEFISMPEGNVWAENQLANTESPWYFENGWSGWFIISVAYQIDEYGGVDNNYRFTVDFY